MISDNPQNDDPDLADDDFELEELDDLETDDDFDLDDFDIDGDIEDDIEDETETLDEEVGVDLSDDEPAPVEKTFIQKFFIPIVLLIVATFGGLFLLGQGFLGGISKNIPVAGQQAPNSAEDMAPLSQEGSVSELNDSEAMPPMPTPIQAQAQEDLDNVPDDKFAPLVADPVEIARDVPQADPQPLEIPTLTPFPGEAAMPAVESTELAQDEPALAAADDPFSEAFEVRDAAPVEEIDTEILVNNDDAILTAETLEAVPQPEEALEPIKAEVGALSAQAEETQQKNADLQKQQDVLSASLLDLETQKSQLEEEKLSLQKTIETQQLEVEKLSQTLSSLKKDVAATQRERDALSNSVPKEQPRRVKPQVKPVVKTTAKKSTATSVASSKPEYDLRSAQPGKATLSIKSTGDFRVVEVGDTLKGLGKIQSIQIENGRWVVRGSAGTVNQ